MGKPGLTPLIDAAYGLEPDDEGWTRGLALAARATLDEGLGVGAFFIDFRGVDDGKVPTVVEAAALALDETTREFIATVLTAARGDGDRPPPGGLLQRVFGDQAAFHRMRDELHRDGLDGLWRHVAPAVGDMLMLSTGCALGAALLVVVPRGHRSTPSARRRAALDDVARHLRQGLELRLTFASPDPAAAADGASPLVRLRRQAVRAAEAPVPPDGPPFTAGASPDDDDAVADHWAGLLRGDSTLVDAFDVDGERFVVAVPTPGGGTDPRALSPVERSVAGLAALGYSNQRIADVLGLGPSTVAGLLQRAMKKLRIETRADLALLATHPVP